MVIPADPEEMQQFQAQCVAQCQCVVDISLPLACILLPSKQAFQSLYNRCVAMCVCVQHVCVLFSLQPFYYIVFVFSEGIEPTTLALLAPMLSPSTYLLVPPQDQQ